MSQIVKKATKNPKFIAELQSKRENAAVGRSMIRKLVEDLNQSDAFIDSIAQVQRLVKEQLDIQAKRRLVQQVMRKDLRMRYKIVKPLSWMANSQKNLILRQRFALAFFEIDLQKKTVLNIDETWLGMSDFRRRKWRPHRHTNSVAKLTIAPRISMVAGIDSNGEVFFSLLQANSNSEVMLLVFQNLIMTLDKARPGWRSTHIILMDNAPYHKSSKMLTFLADQKVPVIFTGAHSYDASPCELLFAAFKSKDINPWLTKTSKK